jgi:predicted AlkP superfamily pyrophosphatase or phosphodiesterase
MKRLFVPCFLLALLAGAVPVPVLAASSGASHTRAPATAKYVALIVLDGGRPNYIANHLKQMPNLRQLMTSSRTYDRAWVGDLMSITPPGHAVIGTGSFPKDDGGIVNWDWGIHSTGKISPTFQALANYQNGYAFQVIKNSGTPTLAGMIHSKYPSGLVVAGSGAHFHAAGPMGGPDANWIFAYDRIKGNWAPYTLGLHAVPQKILSDPTLRTPLASSNGSTVPLTYDPLALGKQDSLVMAAGAKAVQLYRPRGLMLNLPEVDTIGHWSKHWAQDIGILYRAFDSDLGKLVAAYKRAGIYSQTLFVVTADHGMIQSVHRVLDTQAVKDQINSVLGPHKSILVNGGGAAGPTMTSIWLKNPADNQRMAQAIWNKHYDNVSAIFYLTNSGGQYAYKMAGCEGNDPSVHTCPADLVKAYSYLLSTEAGPTGEDVAILLRENARNSGLPDMLGRHGGADWGSQHITLIMAGPGVKAGVSQHPARLADLAPTIERFMGITPRARDGIVLADAFQQPVDTDVQAQTTSDATTNVYANALIARANNDIKLEKAGLLANSIPSNEIIIHWKRRLVVTVAGVLVLIGTAIGLAWAIAEVRRQGTGLTWTA